MHLSTVNIGRLLEPLEAPRLAGFVAALEPINRLADDSPGFVWRLQTEDGDATALRPFDDDLVLVNLAVWESLEALRAFVYSSAHVQVLRQRRDWFERLTEAHMALWWVEPGHLPTVAEAIDRLERLRREGPSPAAFTFRTPFAADSVDGAGPGQSLVDAEFCWPEPVAG